MMKRFEPPYLGAAYYPEAWRPQQVDEDIRLMLDAGLNCARLAEFAWSAIEPEEGRIELDWLRRVVDKLGAAGIATIMCTPSCTPPAWLTGKYPEVLVVEHDGTRLKHGSRRHVCPTSTVYRDHCARVVTAMAEAFGSDQNVIGWQIDNEVYIWKDWGCYCAGCVQAFHEWLTEKYGTIGNLNAAWGTSIWSQTYSSFLEIPAPSPSLWHHPSLLTAWIVFQGQMVTAYVHHQADILHRIVEQPVGTDMMPSLGISYAETHKKLDLVQYNHYDNMNDLWHQVFWMDYVRPFRPAPFWNTETATCWNGGVTANGVKDPGFCRANSWLPIALGAEANLYWLWRSHWSGQELMHGSVVSSAGRPLHIIDEVREVAEGFRASRDLLNGTRPVPPGLAVHLSSLAWAQVRFQPMVKGLEYIQFMKRQVYKPLMDCHLRADIIDPAASLERYRMVYSPLLPALDESGLRERLLDWIKAGGTWVAGPLTDVRTTDAAKFTHAPFGNLEKLTGVFCEYELPGDPRDYQLQWENGTQSSGSLWYAGFEPNGAHVIATYADGPLSGLAAIAQVQLGNGRIILMGTHLPEEQLQVFLTGVAAECGLRPCVSASPNVLFVPRSGKAGEGAVLVELHNRPGEVTLSSPVRDLLTGKVLYGAVAIEPYQVMVLQLVRTGCESGATV